jgi:exosortase
LIQEANPDWRPIQWVHGILVVSLTLYLIKATCGKAWAKHFLLPCGFILIAVPWPSAIETPLIQELMNKVAALTVELLNWSGYSALQRGNIIELSSGSVGVDEACSGVRSLQSTLMAGVFLGGLYDLSWKRRLALVGGALACSLGLNFALAFMLTMIAVRGGHDGLARWHDPAGFAMLLISFAALWLLAKKLAPAAQEEITPATPRPLPQLPPAPWAIGLICWLVSVEVATAGWYAAREGSLAWRGSLQAQPPRQAEGYREQPVTPGVRQILRCDSVAGAIWRGEGGSLWQFFLIDWQPGRVSARMSKVHSPELCLSAAGLRLVAHTGVERVQLGTMELPVQTYTFESRNVPVYVFFAVWEDRIAPATEPEEQTAPGWRSRLRDTWAGRRHFGQQVLEVAISGVPDQATARRQFQAFAKSALSISRK